MRVRTIPVRAPKGLAEHPSPAHGRTVGDEGRAAAACDNPGVDTSPLLLVGGTFDPPHIGHLVLAECARVQFRTPTVLFLPAGNPYRKAARDVSDASHRLAMTRLAVQDNPAFVVDDREVRRSGPSYTVDTLEELHAEGHTSILLVLGTDAIADMPNWKAPERIVRLATIAVAPKPPTMPGEEILPAPHAEAPTLRTLDARAWEFIQMPPLPISSSLIRQRIAADKPIRYLVPDAVERYIRDHNLYATG